jgi:hypothetical protein
MYITTNERSSTVGAAPAPPRLHPRCRSLVLTVPATYAALEEAVRRWISTCVMSRTEVRPGVPIRRENELVTGNSSLRELWDRLLQRMKGQPVEILAEYIWGPNRVESINFSTYATSPKRRQVPPPQPWEHTEDVKVVVKSFIAYIGDKVGDLPPRCESPLLATAVALKDKLTQVATY